MSSPLAAMSDGSDSEGSIPEQIGMEVDSVRGSDASVADSSEAEEVASDCDHVGDGAADDGTAGDGTAGDGTAGDGTAGDGREIATMEPPAAATRGRDLSALPANALLDIPDDMSAVPLLDLIDHIPMPLPLRREIERRIRVPELFLALHALAPFIQLPSFSVLPLIPGWFEWAASMRAYFGQFADSEGTMVAFQSGLAAAIKNRAADRGMTLLVSPAVNCPVVGDGGVESADGMRLHRITPAAGLSKQLRTKCCFCVNCNVAFLRKHSLQWIAIKTAQYSSAAARTAAMQRFRNGGWKEADILCSFCHGPTTQGLSGNDSHGNAFTVNDDGILTYPSGFREPAGEAAASASTPRLAKVMTAVVTGMHGANGEQTFDGEAGIGAAYLCAEARQKGNGAAQCAGYPPIWVTVRSDSDDTDTPAPLPSYAGAMHGAPATAVLAATDAKRWLQASFRFATARGRRFETLCAIEYFVDGHRYSYRGEGEGASAQRVNEEGHTIDGYFWIKRSGKGQAAWSRVVNAVPIEI